MAELVSTHSFRQLIADRVAHREPGVVPWFLHDKSKAYEFCKKVGVPTAKVLQIEKSVKQIRFNDLPASFVIKPTTGHSSRGVMLLERAGSNGTFTDLMSRKAVTMDEIVASQEAFRAENRFPQSYRVMAEELLTPEDGRTKVVRDYKLYTFGGRVALILQKDVNLKPLRYNWFDGDWRPLPLEEVVDGERAQLIRAGERLVAATGDKLRLAEGSHVLPACWRAMREMAAKLSKAAATPFVRTDMYATARGPVLGEFTLAPAGVGADVFTDEWDELLGTLWNAGRALALDGG